MNDLNDHPQTGVAEKPRWSLWLTPVLLLASLSLCGMNYLELGFIPLYYLVISSNRLIFVTIFSVIIVLLLGWMIFTTRKLSPRFPPGLRITLNSLNALTLLFICINVGVTLFIGIFAGFYELDRVTFNGQVYRLVLNEDLDIHYTYGLCQCKGFGERCQCDHFFSTKTPHNRNIPKLGVDLGMNILQVKFDQELWYEYDGETATCYEIIQLTGTCLNN